MDFISGNAQDAFNALASDERNVIVNGILAAPLNLHVGDVIPLATPTGQQDYRIVAIGSDVLSIKINTAYISQANMKLDFNKSEDILYQVNLASDANIGTAEQWLNQIAGDPQSARKWKRKNLHQLSEELKPAHTICPHTVGRLLAEQKYSLHVSTKELDRRASPHRNEQFEYIQTQIQAFSEQGCPIISVDTKKRELIGCFRNPGRVWSRKATRVNIYDFRSLAKGIAILYGVYDLTRNVGYVFVGRLPIHPNLRWMRFNGGGQRMVGSIIRMHLPC